MLYLNDEFSKTWQGQDPFKLVQAIEGKIYREVKNRKTLQFSLNGRSYFLKMHFGVGWAEIFKNILQLRLPITSAENEWNAVNRLHDLSIDTMTVVAYGKRGLSPAALQSFIITEDLHNTVSLEEFCARWPDQTPAFAVKSGLIYKVARAARAMHTNGICHRDFYICHFLLHKGGDGEFINLKSRLSLIDLHRALIKENLGSRWIEKDIAGLYFSCMEIGLTQRDLFRFMCTYKGKGLRETLEEDAQFWKQVTLKATALYEKLNRHQ